MLKNILFTLVFVFAMIGCSDNDEQNNPIPEIKETYVPDNNFEQKLIDLGYDDVLDDYVVTFYIRKIVELKLDSLGIKDLTGIEDFESLTELYCRNNELKNLDLSKNKFLEVLYCDNNQLTTLDITNNTSLLRLWCWRNQLKNLDVSNN